MKRILSIYSAAQFICKGIKKGNVIKEEDIFPLTPVKSGAVLLFKKQNVIGKDEAYTDDIE